MASVSPSPNSPPVTVPPLSPPLVPSAPNSSPPSTSSPPSQSPPPTPTTQSSPPSTSSPPPSSPPPTSTSPPPLAAPPPSTPPITSPPPVSTSPPTNPPPPSSPTPPTNSSPPQTNTPPPAESTPPPVVSPPPTATSPPPPVTSPPRTNPPPPVTSTPPTRSPPPSSPSPPARSSPPPTSSTRSPPPPRTPSTRSPPPPPTASPPSPSSTPPSRSPPPSSSSRPPPESSSPPPTSTPPPPSPPQSSEPPTNSSPPPVTTPTTNPSPPPPTTTSPPSRPSPPSPSTILLTPPGIPTNNDTSPNTPSSNGGIGTGGIVGISTVLGLVLLTVIITVACCIIKRKKKISRNNNLYNLPTTSCSSPKSESGLLKIQASDNGNVSANEFIYIPPDPNGIGNSRPKFTYEDLFEATNGFSNLLGSGGFGSVYKGCLVDGTEVAVKELKIGGGQGEREFSAEVEIIGRIHHRYLVSLVGYCVSENNRLLVYEYVPNNTLYFHLHGSEAVLDWSTRVKVASGAARGIAYLHEDCHPRIIHRDIKSSNILLDKNFEARVSDFGLAKLAADLNTHVTTRVMGTFGYMAPEYASSGKLTEKSDVYSFGVVLLELITGRKPVDASQPLGDESLVEWARPLLSHALETEDFEVLVDPKLGTNYVAEEMFRMIEAAAACVRHSATKRPRMVQIVRAFESMETEDLSNGMRVGESEIFNSAQQSAEIRLFNRMAFGSQNYSTDFFTQGSFGPNSNER
ncbi:hypothetical protein L1887_30867 [Cichorium endivia]|nr:hypothetical protein L1887_30867 [Cichorium endivia]